MTTIIAWVTAHQMLMLALWPLMTAGASLAYTTLDHNTKWHAFFSSLASVGVDLPKLWDALGRLLTGGQTPPANPPAVVVNPPDAVKSPSKKPPTLSRSLLAFVSCCVVILVIGCQKPIVLPPSAPADVEAVAACVTADVIVGRPVDNCVAQYGIILVNDVLQTLIHSKSFMDEHPEGVAYTKAQLKAVKLQIKTLEEAR